MPNWKKVIVSGSDASLNNLNVANAITASGLYVSGSIIQFDLTQSFTPNFVITYDTSSYDLTFAPVAPGSSGTQGIIGP